MPYGRPAWTKLRRRWLTSLKFEQTVHHIVLEDYIAAVEAAQARLLAWMGHCRQLAKDFERHARKAAAFIRLAMIRIMLRRITANRSA